MDEFSSNSVSENYMDLGVLAYIMFSLFFQVTFYLESKDNREPRKHPFPAWEKWRTMHIGKVLF